MRLNLAFLITVTLGSFACAAPVPRLETNVPERSHQLRVKLVTVTYNPKGLLPMIEPEKGETMMRTAINSVMSPKFTHVPDEDFHFLQTGDKENKDIARFTVEAFIKRGETETFKGGELRLAVLHLTLVVDRYQFVSCLYSPKLSSSNPPTTRVIPFLQPSSSSSVSAVFFLTYQLIRALPLMRLNLTFLTTIALVSFAYAVPVPREATSLQVRSNPLKVTSVSVTYNPAGLVVDQGDSGAAESLMKVAINNAMVPKFTRVNDPNAFHFIITSASEDKDTAKFTLEVLKENGKTKKYKGKLDIGTSEMSVSEPPRA
ncbi:hypothetical protein F5877DRAFT_81558 [Lentinula edodes]|nr:hypothetical protein F5877DRAFT_81558 [Lentinula edodes]